ncbi:MAG: terminase family protein [Paracoccaceae bacterium]|uniref:DNA-packaging protein n=1 Tax=unclassified Seohaeicola TaxID=2641111 RepID=UPI00237A3AB8|nr:MULTISPECIES: terminase family protein [unclassified Seohaeicola]MDD9706194.1 terminase family protein [Seohaeicola sp. 4SK31]MDD9734653.1 terminase family protein [Seohaeicola sp. SP36]MDF1708050.1 terminase family protein [Paracoccaceae bacterium]
MPSTLTQPDLRSGADWIACETAEVQKSFLDDLTEGELLALPFMFDFWAMPHQLPPEGTWRSWVIMGGRGAGKTRAGAEWVRAQVEGSRPNDSGRCRRIALVGETLDQVREVMVFGDSGILACSPPDRRPEWHATRRMLIWPNGATAQAFSAHDPESLRGPQFDGAWVDELAKWKKGHDTWDMLQFALRLGDDPRVCVTTTPRNVGVLKDLLKMSSTVVTHAPTEANAANLATSFLEEVRIRYAGSRLSRQELDGILVEDAEGALWTGALLEGARVSTLPEMDRIVVAIDPATTSSEGSDACGIMVVGAVTRGPVQDWQAFVLEDASTTGLGPFQWAGHALAAMRRWDADRLVVEVNQGGDMIEALVRQIDPLVPFRKLHASRSKGARAEPVAALYEQGRVFHHGDLGDLEDQMCAMTAQGYAGKGSPDRLDALVWALHELIIAPSAKWQQPRVRAL